VSAATAERRTNLKIVEDAVANARPGRLVPIGVVSNIPQVDIAKLIDLGYGRSMRGEVSSAPQWEEPLVDFVQHLRARKMSPNSIGLRSYQIRHVSRYFLDRAPWSVTGRELEAVLGAEAWGKATARSHMNGWRSFFDWMIESGEYPITRNPCKALGTIQAPTGKPRPASYEAIDAAVAAAPDRVRLMIYLGAELGLRRAEIARIHTRDLFDDSEGRMIRVLGKGDKTRDLPLSDRIAALLANVPEGWVFPRRHKGVDDGTVADYHIGAIRVGELVSEALPPGTTTHMLRHRFATDLYVATGNNIIAVQNALGHESVATTQIYTEVPKSAIRAGMNRMRNYG
jgi:integrase